ncbi:MAG: FAD-binding oxidoreductase [Leptospirales bacterium]|nr:FAD-binding oxidoreductase [Leptospirales bacterium]
MLTEGQKKQLGAITRLILPEELSKAELADWSTDRTRLPGSAAGILLPESTEQVQSIIQYANQANLAIVPSGGRTGYAGGAVARDELVLSLSKMDRLIAKDAHLPALHVQSGMITAHLQKEAEKMGFYFPVDFASSGSSQIGGNIATNAGGIHVVRYGMIRNYVQALTVVTGGGQILKTGSTVRKDNTGPDLSQVFIGSEGILGIITEATLRLERKPRDTQLAFLAVPDIGSVLELLRTLRSQIDLLAFECFDARSLRSVQEHLNIPDPFAKSAWYVIAEWEDSGTVPELDCDAQIAVSSEHKKRTWKYREAISESLSMRTVYKNDVSIPLPRMEEYTNLVRARAAELKIEIAIFGHVGDGNLHVNVIAPDGFSKEEFRLASERFTDYSYGLIEDMAGSISAEHGIGILKREAFLKHGTPGKAASLLALKRVFDPNGIMNPGKIV